MHSQYGLSNIRGKKISGRLLAEAVPGGNDLYSFPPPWSIFNRDLFKKTSKLSHVSLFSGCGGVDLGCWAAGFQTVFANDIDEDACATYARNLGAIEGGDIKKVEFSNIKIKSRPDLLSAGFPCQPFSNAGSRKGLRDDRGTLYEVALGAVAYFKPKSVLFENVRGLLSFKIDDHKLFIAEICERLSSLGYSVVFSLLDASKHHVPQKRLRTVIVGIACDCEAGTFCFPPPVERNDLSLKNTIFDVNPEVPNQDEILQLNPQALYLGGMVPEGGSWKDIPYDKLPDRLKRISDDIRRYRWPNFYRRFHRDEVAGTVTAAFKPENAGVWHPVESRVLSAREIARIQSFPDWFIFDGRTIKSKYQQIGNAVPPRLAYELALQIKRALRGKMLRRDDEFITFDQFEKSGKPLRAKDATIVFS